MNRLINSQRNMNSDQIYILFSYELLKSDLGESSFADFLKSESNNCKEIYLKRSSLTVKEFTDSLYTSFLSDIIYLKLLNFEDNYWNSQFSQKIEVWIKSLDSTSNFVKFYSDYISRLNKIEIYEYISSEINSSSGTDQIYITLPQNNNKLMNDLTHKLRKKNPNISPVFIIDTGLIGGIKIQFKESLYDYSWQNQIKSKLLL